MSGLKERSFGLTPAAIISSRVANPPAKSEARQCRRICGVGVVVGSSVRVSVGGEGRGEQREEWAVRAMLTSGFRGGVWKWGEEVGCGSGVREWGVEVGFGSGVREWGVEVG